MTPVRAATVAALAVVAALGVTGGRVADATAQSDDGGVLVLPAPVGTIPLIAPDIVTPERRRTTFVPGPVSDDERIAIQLGTDGAPTTLVVRQRLALTGTGDFAVRERGPALRVTALEGTVAPIIQRGTVVWQGFVPGERLLAADLELDPGREALLLPLRVEISWTSTSGGAPIGAGGRIPSAGRLEVRLVNQTARVQQVPTALTDAAAIAPALDALRSHAVTPSLMPPPAAGRGLPTTVPATDLGVRELTVAAPLRISGSVRVSGVSGVTVSGPGTTPTAARDGADVAGVLAGETSVSLDVPRAGDLVVDLVAVPSLDPRRLAPPGGAPTWSAWARTSPDDVARRAAVDTLVEAAASSARADEVAPYLGHPGPGPTTTEFRYSLAPAAKARVARAPLSPRPVPIAATTLLLAGAVFATTRLWRRL